MADNRKRKTAAQRRREIRTALIHRWDQVAADVHHLVNDMRRAPRGTFTDDELAIAVVQLDQTVLDVMMNDRPHLPPSEPRRTSKRRNP